MRILFSVPRYHPNHDGMVLGLQRAGHDVAFLVRHGHPTERHLDGVDITRIPGPRHESAIEGMEETAFKLQDTALPPLRFLYSFLRETRPDIVIARNTKALNISIFLICRSMGIKFLLYLLGGDGYEKMTLSRRLRLRAGLWPRHTINTVCQTPAAQIPGKTYDFIPFAIEPYEYQKTDYPATLPLRILAIGKLDQARKNHMPLVRSIAPLLKDRSAVLVIAGLRNDNPGPAYAKLLDEINTLGVGGSVSMQENLSYDQARALYQQHDLFVMASSNELAGIAPIEAMATGLAVITSSDSGTKYFITPGETGEIFESGNFDDLAEKIKYFGDNLPEVERMGRNARATILRDYSPERFEQRFMDIVSRRFGPQASAR